MARSDRVHSEALGSLESALDTSLQVPPTIETRHERAQRFTYGPLEVDEVAGIVRCSYLLDGLSFTEVITVGPGLPWSPTAREAARLVHLVAGVSYYKAGAPPVIDLAATMVRDGEREFLREYFVRGLAEFAYKNRLDLTGIEVVGGQDGTTSPGAPNSEGSVLIPFGGGIDSIVTADLVCAHRPSALFVLNRPGCRFSAIEAAAQVTGLPVTRAERELDLRLIQISRLGSVFNGHVPITAVVSAVAVLVAVLHGRSEVAMSNEWSASQPNLNICGRTINHQHSKSWAYEQAFRSVLSRAIGPEITWYSMLRPFSELWVARRFANLRRYHGVVHSCNRAFYLDPTNRLATWCGECDKCCFIDLILSPFMATDDLAAIFDGPEPLANPSLLPQFRLLLGIGGGIKPFECVGDVDECRAAATMAADRPDRASNHVLTRLVDELGPAAGPALAASDRLMRPLGDHAVPTDLLAVALA